METAAVDHCTDSNGKKKSQTSSTMLLSYYIVRGAVTHIYYQKLVRHVRNRNSYTKELVFFEFDGLTGSSREPKTHKIRAPSYQKAE
jgi:hypothetical protein